MTTTIVSAQHWAVIGLVIIAFAWVYVKVGINWTKAAISLILILLALLFAFVHFLGTPFSGQAKIATISCQSPAPHQMLVTLNGSTYELAGDRWTLQSSVVEIQPVWHFLGVTSTGGSLDRLDSEFDNPNHPAARPIQLGGFSLYKMTDGWMLAHLIIKSSYGSGVVQNCDDRTYIIYVDQAGDLSAERLK